MIVLGIDPGIARVGWGFVRKEKRGEVKPVAFGCITTDAEEDEQDRLFSIHRQLSALIKKHKPDHAAIEKLFFAANAKTALIVGQARGVIVLTTGMFAIPSVSYTPLEVKMALTGYGSSDKKQVQKMVQFILRLPSVPQPDDTADALAVALAFCSLNQFKQRTHA